MMTERSACLGLPVLIESTSLVTAQATTNLYWSAKFLISIIGVGVVLLVGRA